MLNGDGYLPAGVHDMDMHTLKTVFVDGFQASKSRPAIFEGFERYLADLAKLDLQVEMFLDGSFVTAKVDPGDIDLVCFADVDALDALAPEVQQAFKALVAGKVTKASHQCDAYFCPKVPEGHPAFDKVRANRKYWMGEFGYDRQDRPKGIVRHEPLKAKE